MVIYFPIYQCYLLHALGTCFVFISKHWAAAFQLNIRLSVLVGYLNVLFSWSNMTSVVVKQEGNNHIGLKLDDQFYLSFVLSLYAWDLIWTFNINYTGKGFCSFTYTHTRRLTCAWLQEGKLRNMLSCLGCWGEALHVELIDVQGY